MKNYEYSPRILGISAKEIQILFTFKLNREALTKFVLFLVAAFLTPLTLLGALIGFRRSYLKFDFKSEKLPNFYPMSPRTRFAMITGAIFAWVVLGFILFVVVKYIPVSWLRNGRLFVYAFVNIVLSTFVYIWFIRWQIGVNNMIVNLKQHASSNWATEDELRKYMGKRGLFMGGDLAVPDKTHMLILGNTRSHKGTSLIIPNILRIKHHPGSMIVLDIKGEGAAICSRVLKEQGYNVQVINPWELHPNHIKTNTAYNPLEFLSDKSSPHLIDDIAIVAEMICEVKKDDRNAFFQDSARNIIASLLLHMVTSVERPTLSILFEWCRLSSEGFNELIADMSVNDDPVNGKAIRASANAIASMMQNMETFSSIISNVLRSTDFLKSSALQQSLVSGLNPYSVAEDGNTVVFVVCPVDKVSSHSAWLRLVTTTLMRSVVRKPKHRVTFLIDEAASSIGYSEEIGTTALSAYAGFGVSIILVYQDLSQIRGVYGDKWETVTANCSIRLVTSASDNFTASYISKGLGDRTRTVYSKDWMGNITDSEHHLRPLATPDEVRKITRDSIIVMTSEGVSTTVPKQPYYLMPALKDATGKNLYDPNPYIENSL